MNIQESIIINQIIYQKKNLVEAGQKAIQENRVNLQKYYLLNQAQENALLVMLIVVFQEVVIVLINMYLIMAL